MVFGGLTPGGVPEGKPWGDIFFREEIFLPAVTDEGCNTVKGDDWMVTTLGGGPLARRIGGMGILGRQKIVWWKGC